MDFIEPVWVVYFTIRRGSKETPHEHAFRAKDKKQARELFKYSMRNQCVPEEFRKWDAFTITDIKRKDVD